MRKFVSIPLEQLVSDVAVDSVHVKELADSMMTSGQLSPVLVREGSLEIIDGFHRVEALKELGFAEAECLEVPCDDDFFWDCRIMSAVLHKAVTFARAIEWIDAAFKISGLGERYTSAYGAFRAVRDGTAPEIVKRWAEDKARRWGVGVHSIENWLRTRSDLAPDLLEEAKAPTGEGALPTSHYVRLAHSLPGRPELQRAVAEKAKAEDLSQSQLDEVAKAVRRARDSDEVKTILSQPVGRTAEELSRAATVEKLLREPTVTPTPSERRYQLTGLALEVYLDLQQQIHNVRRLRPEILDTLTAAQRGELLQVVDELMVELQRVADSLRGVLETRAIEGRET